MAAYERYWMERTEPKLRVAYLSTPIQLKIGLTLVILAVAVMAYDLGYEIALKRAVEYRASVDTCL